METAWKSNNIKTGMQAPLPPLVIDALVQTESVSRKNETCQTEKSTGIECAVQADLERRWKFFYPEGRTFGTQTKVENVEITRIDAIVQTDSSTLKNGSCQTDKSKRNDFQTEACQTEKATGIECEVQANLYPERRTFGTQTIKVENDEIAMTNIPSSSSSKIDKKRKICSSKAPPQKIPKIQTPNIRRRVKGKCSRKFLDYLK